MLELLVSPGSPTATLEQARDAIRSWKRSHGGQLPEGGVTVWLTGGDYLLEHSFELTAEDGGTPEAPVIYRAREGEVVRLLGGRLLTGFQPVTDDAVLTRISPEARPHVRVADLRAQGITDCGHFQRRGFGCRNIPAHLELFYDGRPMMVARWPDDGECTRIAGFVEERHNEWNEAVGELHAGFRYESDRPRRWASFDDLWVHGYWCWDWANSYEQVTKLDPETRTIETAPPHGLYAFRPGQPFYFLNILEELTAPGEFYTDRQHGLLYFWPPDDRGDGEALISLLETPLLHLQDVSHLTLQGFVLEGGRGSGIAVEGGEDVRIAGCILRNLGNLGIIIRGGHGHTVRSCDISFTGDGAIDLSGGDRKTLAPAGHVVENCHLHHFARWSRTYHPGVHATGCGMRIAHNLIHDTPHTAVLYGGNDILVEANEIYRVCLETGDAGAIYTGRDYTYRGNAVRDNFIHHMGGLGIGTSAIYMDDCVSGHDIAGNVVWGGDAIWLGGGRDFRIHDNVFIDCKGAVCFDARGVDRNPVWQKMVNTTMRERLEEMQWMEAPYAKCYPELQPLAAHFAAGAGVPPENNITERNLCVGCAPVRLGFTGELRDDWLAEVGNVVDGTPGFLDPAWGDFRLRADAPTLQHGIRPPALETVGVAADALRPDPPALVRSRLEIIEIAGGGVTLQLGLRNDGAARAAGCMTIILPDGTAVSWPYLLEAGEMTERTFRSILPAEQATARAFDSEGTARPAEIIIAAPEEN